MKNKTGSQKTQKIANASGVGGANSYLVSIRALVFGWENKEALKIEIRDFVGMNFYDHDDLEIEVIGDDEPGFPHAFMDLERVNMTDFDKEQERRRGRVEGVEASIETVKRLMDQRRIWSGTESLHHYDLVIDELTALKRAHHIAPVPDDAGERGGGFDP
jgi:hypothetical protein